MASSASAASSRSRCSSRTRLGRHSSRSRRHWWNRHEDDQDGQCRGRSQRSLKRTHNASSATLSARSIRSARRSEARSSLARLGCSLAAHGTRPLDGGTRQWPPDFLKLHQRVDPHDRRLIRSNHRGYWPKGTTSAAVRELVKGLELVARVNKKTADEKWHPRAAWSPPRVRIPEGRHASDSRRNFEHWFGICSRGEELASSD